MSISPIRILEMLILPSPAVTPRPTLITNTTIIITNMGITMTIMMTITITKKAGSSGRAWASSPSCWSWSGCG